jgi:amino acid transporter
MRSATDEILQAQRDTGELEAFGYAQELLRSMGGFSSFAISFTIISIITGVFALYDYGLQMAGPLEMTIGWPIVSLGTLFVALSMGELCSAIPTSGGTYHWSAELGGPTWAWFTAWFDIVGLVTEVAAIDYACATYLAPVLQLGSSHSVLLVTYGLILTSHALINHYGIRWVACLNDLGVTAHILGVVVLVGALLLFAPKQPLSFLLSHENSSPVHGSFFWLFLLGMLQAQWTYTGYDGPAQVSEETVDPRHRAPWGIVLGVAISAIFGYLLVVGLTISIPSLSGVLNAKDSAGNSLPAVLAIVVSALGQWPGRAVLLLAVAAMWFCGLSTLTSGSRVIFALARDKGLPLTGLWAKTDRKHRTPAPAIWVAAGLAFFALIYSRSIAVVTSISVVACYLAYATPIYLGWRNKARWLAKRGPWHLGRRSNLINVMALGWTAFICTLMVMPPNTRTGVSMAVVIGVLFLLHYFTGPHEMRKPIWNEIEKAIRIEDPH